MAPSERPLQAGANVPATAAPVIRRAERLTAGEREELADVLVASVAAGASLGFHAPLAPDLAGSWWAQFPRPGVLLLAAARDAAGVFSATVFWYKIL